MKTKFVCQSCGSVQTKWAGQCLDCLSWNTIVEEQDSATPAKKNSKIQQFEDMQAESIQHERIGTNVNELDRVLGGGLVKGSVILLGGDPGIGKSTLLLQITSFLEQANTHCAYISGEESSAQIRLRAQRLGLADSKTKLLTETNIHNIISSLESHKEIKVVVIDSIQTMFVSDMASSPGTVSQVRATSHELINFAKKTGIIVILVGHVTKDGQIAGPKILEHMVDTVLYFEGERGHQYRILRGVKNRYGSINEIGIFEMLEQGLSEVANPSELFLSHSPKNASGSAVFAGMEGSRPVLVELQSLIAPSQMAMPRRSVVGWDSARLAMILAVLGVRYGASLGNKEVYLNVAGGLKISEPAADLAVACSLLSSNFNVAIAEKTVIFGEIGLSGEVRPVNYTDARIKESIKLGFEHVITSQSAKISKELAKQIQITKIMHVKELSSIFQ